MHDNKYSIQNISPTLVEEILQSLKKIEGYGSLEIYIQNQTVTQITVRNIKKTPSKFKTIFGSWQTPTFILNNVNI